MNVDSIHEEYLFVGTTLYRKIEQPMADGTLKPMLKEWNTATLRTELRDSYNIVLSRIPRYKGFAIIPNHIDYKSDIDGFYNRYEPLSHVPTEGDWKHIRSLVEHVFGEQKELGLDYLQLLYTKPVQKLPILLLVSKERATGKTTFLNLLKLIFQENVTFNNNEDFRSQFNSEWAPKLLVLVDEVLLNRKEDSEHLKNLSTALHYKMEAKGKDRYEVQFFAKFVLCTNNEFTPVYIEPDETRFWARKVPKLKAEDVGFLEKVKEEIPAFLHFLQNRNLSTKQESRMWFNVSDIRTSALDKIIQANKNRVEQEIKDLLEDIMVRKGVDMVQFTRKDLLRLLRENEVIADASQVKHVLQKTWGLKPTDTPSTYVRYFSVNVNDSDVCYSTEPSSKGRFYSVSASDLQNL